MLCPRSRFDRYAQTLFSKSPVRWEVVVARALGPHEREPRPSDRVFYQIFGAEETPYVDCADQLHQCVVLGRVIHAGRNRQTDVRHKFVRALLGQPSILKMETFFWIKKLKKLPSEGS